MGFWRGKKVLITGHTGFKGGWLSIWLKRLGAEVTGISLPPSSSPNLFEVANVADGMNSVNCDIRNLGDLKKAIKSYHPEVIIHMAAQALVRPSYVDPIETYATNVMGTANLFEAARSIDSIRVIINVTSDKCYENKEWIWGYREHDPMGGHDPYSSSKGCAELVTNAYRNSFFNNGRISVASVRAGNVIGGGDWAKDRLIPDIVNGIIQGKPIAIRNPNAIRPWQYVCEPLHGYLLLAEKLWGQGQEFAESWNFGPDDDDVKSVRWIADYLCQKWGKAINWQNDSGDNHPHEAVYLKLDCSKAKIRLGWKPRLELATALDWCIEWYKAYQKGADLKVVSEDHVARYQGICSDE